MDVRDEGATSDAGNHWVPFQPSGKVKKPPVYGPQAQYLDGISGPPTP